MSETLNQWSGLDFKEETDAERLLVHGDSVISDVVLIVTARLPGSIIQRAEPLLG
jgi:hypothetical protein